MTLSPSPSDPFAAPPIIWIAPTHRCATRPPTLRCRWTLAISSSSRLKLSLAEMIAATSALAARLSSPRRRLTRWSVSRSVGSWTSMLATTPTRRALRITSTRLEVIGYRTDTPLPRIASEEK